MTSPKIIEYILTKIVDVVFDQTQKHLETKYKLYLISTKNDSKDAINDHLYLVGEWANEISFKDLKKSKALTKTYIELELFLLPQKDHYSEKEAINKLRFNSIFTDSAHNIVLLGQPGAGKTTSVKKLCYEILNTRYFGIEPFDFPILIKINDFSRSSSFSLFDKILEILGIKLNSEDRNTESVIKNTVISFLNNLRCLVIIDGYDEIPNYSLKEQITTEIRELAKTLRTSRLIITSRSADWNIYLEKSSVYEISTLTEEQIKEFTEKWFQNIEQSANFLRETNATSYRDTLDRPIFLSLLCSIYERLGKIPSKPKTVYRKFVNLLLEEWDEQRSIKRATKYSHLDIDVRTEFLAHLAYYLTVVNKSQYFDKEKLKIFYKSVCNIYDLPKNEALDVVEELESHHGIFIQDGYDRFKFFHKSMQEYLCADYILKLPSIPAKIELLNQIPNELAIAIALSSKSTDYFNDLILIHFKNDFQINFLSAFINRLVIENPNFETNQFFALSIIILYTHLINSNQNNNYAFIAINKLLNSDEFNGSFTELKRNTNFRKLSTCEGVNTYHYNHVKHDRFDLSYLYNQYLKFDR